MEKAKFNTVEIETGLDLSNGEQEIKGKATIIAEALKRLTNEKTLKNINKAMWAARLRKQIETFLREWQETISGLTPDSEDYLEYAKLMEIANSMEFPLEEREQAIKDLDKMPKKKRKELEEIHQKTIAERQEAILEVRTIKLEAIHVSELENVKDHSIIYDLFDLIEEETPAE